jgi:pimeloyl-ACP methyl ester carboxylesterase
VDGTRTRPILDVVGDRPKPGASFGLTRDVWLDPDQAGLDSKDVTITTLEGARFPAWQIPSRKASGAWAVLTHGRGAARSEMLRMGTILHKAGFNLLIITYTGDAGAPQYPDGMNQYGRVEWRELESAVEYASDQGARRIILGGASHGGAVTLGLLARSPLSSRVDGVILDAPASSLRDVIDEAAESEKLPIVGRPIPESLEDAAMTLVAWRYGVNYSTVDYTDKQGLVPMPLLMIQGADDRTVVPAVNDRFMHEGPGQGNAYLVVPGAGHVMSWNVDPKGYEKAIQEFLKRRSTANQD